MMEDDLRWRALSDGLSPGRDALQFVFLKDGSVIF